MFTVAHSGGRSHCTAIVGDLLAYSRVILYDRFIRFLPWNPYFCGGLTFTQSHREAPWSVTELWFPVGLCGNFSKLFSPLSALGLQGGDRADSPWRWAAGPGFRMPRARHSVRCCLCSSWCETSSHWSDSHLVKGRTGIDRCIFHLFDFRD